MKGIVLAGGLGTRLHPITLSMCKQLLPVYDKPMIYYPISVLMLAGIREILIIATEEDLPRFRNLFQDGSHLGLDISYAIQKKPEGIAHAFLVASAFIGDESVCLILGDNIFYGQDLPEILRSSSNLEKGATIFGYEVKDPERYGVLAFDENRKISAIVEKPTEAPSRFAVTGLYFYDSDVVELARTLKPSKRGELEITDLNMLYLQRGELRVQLLGRGFAWLDTGTCDSLQKAASYIQTIQERQGIKIACLEEIAYDMGYIDDAQLKSLALSLSKSEYGAYLLDVLAKAQEPIKAIT